MHVIDEVAISHRNHMEAINEIFKAGSLKAMVEKGILKKESCEVYHE